MIVARVSPEVATRTPALPTRADDRALATGDSKTTQLINSGSGWHGRGVPGSLQDAQMAMHRVGTLAAFTIVLFTAGPAAAATISVAAGSNLQWIGHDGSVQLQEVRSIGWTALNDQAWKLIFESDLHADSGAEINSPGSKGRVGGGYGGFFWRFPAGQPPSLLRARTPPRQGSHGSYGYTTTQAWVPPLPGTEQRC